MTTANTLLNAMSRLQERNQAYAVATVIEVVGSASAKTGSKILFDANGRVITGWVGGGCAESTVCSEALACLETGVTAIVDIDMDDEVLGVGMPCGGHMRVFVEPVLAKPVIWVMGHGEVAEKLCELANMSDFVVIVNDPGADAEKYPNAHEIINDDIDYQKLQPGTNDFVVIATQHKGDHESMSQALNTGANYIALIASRKRSRLVMDYLATQGYDESALGKVVAPCGIDLGARTPNEIAMSVLAEIIMLRRGGTGQRMKDTLMQESAASDNRSTISASSLSPRLQAHGKR